MYYFRYHVRPAINHPQSSDLGGAVANVFVDNADPVAAESRARQYLIGQLWEVVSLDQTGEVRDKADFEHDKMLVDLHQRAKDAGIACLAAAYPLRGERSDNVPQMTNERSQGNRNAVASQISPNACEAIVGKEELDRRAILITEQYAGIHPPYETFYIRSVIYSAGRAREAFERFTVAKAAGDTNENQVSAIHEALGHAGSLSRFFWPSGLGGRGKLKGLKTARAKKLREAFGLTDNSPLKDRRLRDFLEHFDERLDEYLLRNDAGYFFPDAMIGEVELADERAGHIFKLVDPRSSCFVLLGEKHFFQGIQTEVYSIYDLAVEMDKSGCRLRRDKTDSS
jgi:hypothetical protein